MPLGTPTESGASQGKIVFGTVKGDIHTIGKDLVVGMLRAAGYDVADLGIDLCFRLDECNRECRTSRWIATRRKGDDRRGNGHRGSIEIYGYNRPWMW